MRNSISQIYALRCLAVGGYLSTMVSVYLTVGATGVAGLVWLLHRHAPTINGPCGVFILAAGIQVFTFACAFSCENMGQALLKRRDENESS